MSTHYLESRRRIHYLPANMVADITRHLHARQHLGKAIIICDSPTSLLPLALKQWLKLSRTLQRRRGFTSNAVEILKYTYTITQMQHMNFVADTPQEQPEAQAFFVRPKQLHLLPLNCYTVYLTVPLPDEALAQLITELPPSSLLVDYVGQAVAGDFGLKSKADLEQEVAVSWQVVESFLAKQRVDMKQLMQPALQSAMMDDALDVLLGVDAEFLGIAGMFQRSLDMARPLRDIPKFQRDRYETFILLAHRVQTFAPGGFSAQFLKTYADDTFFLRDVRLPQESVSEAMARHFAAGRLNLVRALMQYDHAPAQGRVALAV